MNDLGLKSHFLTLSHIFSLIFHWNQIQFSASSCIGQDYDLLKKDINGKIVLDWAREKNNQAALDAFLKNKVIRQAVFHGYFKGRGWKFPGEASRLQVTIGLLEWHILLRAPVSKIKSYIEGGAVYDNKILYVLALDGNLPLLHFFLDDVKKKQQNLNLLDLINSPEILPLSGAAANGHVHVVEYLLEKGANPNLAGARWDNRTPLCLAAARGHVEVVKLLLSKNVDTQGAIHEAAGHGHLEIVELLLGHDKRLIEKWKRFAHETPLYFAAASGHVSVVGYLLEQGASISGDSFHPAAENGHLDVLKLLVAQQPSYIYIPKCGKDSSFKDGKDSLVLAAANGHMDIVLYLLERGKNGIFSIFNSHEKAFFGAAKNGHIGIVELLVQKYPELLNKVDPQSLLTSVVSGGHIEIVKYLLGQGVKPVDFEALLKSAVKMGHSEVLKVLLSHENANHEICISPLLQLAHLQRSETIVAILLETYLSSVNSPVELAEKFKSLDESSYQHVLSYCDSEKTLSFQPESLSGFFEKLSASQFKTFVTHAVQLGLCSIDDVISTAQKNKEASIENFKNNQKFILNQVAPFTPYRKKIEGLIGELKAKSDELKRYPVRAKAITQLATTLQKETNAFFTNPTHEKAQTLFFACAYEIMVARSSIDIPRTSGVWRGVNKILLIAAHLFVVTIPLIWLHPASRNLLLDITDSQAKADAVLESVRALKQLAIHGEFNSFFSPVPAAKPSVDENSSANHQQLNKTP